MNRLTAYLRQHWFWLLVNAVAIFPLAWLAWDFATDNLSVNPVRDITFRTGKPALIVLLASLACTPLQVIVGWRQAGTVRKALGLQAFVYASLHLFTFLGLDYAFDLNLILLDGLPQKPYILVGLAAFLILLPLAITSTQGWQKRLGRKWKSLHRAVYAAGVLAVLHFFWLARASDLRPLYYGLALALLLIVRVPRVRSALVKWRQRRFGKPATSARSPILAQRVANPTVGD